VLASVDQASGGGDHRSSRGRNAASRVYTQSHIDYVAEVVISVASGAAELAGFRITSQAPLLRHFTARFEPLSRAWPDDGS